MFSKVRRNDVEARNQHRAEVHAPLPDPVIDDDDDVNEAHEDDDCEIEEFNEGDVGVPPPEDADDDDVDDADDEDHVPVVPPLPTLEDHFPENKAGVVPVSSGRPRRSRRAPNRPCFTH